MVYRIFNLCLLCAALLLTAALGAKAMESLPLPILDWEVRSDWVNVKSLGASGDGKADDTDAIQKALNMITEPRASGAGISIYFPAGIYRVTRTLKITSEKRPVNGVLLVGRGRESRLLWDGSEGGTLLETEGMAYSRIVGIEFDGANKAAIGRHHINMKTFETAARHSNLAFRNFTRVAVYAEPKDRFAMAETHFENCIFENNGIGVSFVQFNDYDITFNGCDFRRNGIGIECVHGHFFVRDTHFEESRDCDIVSAPEHNSSVRRSTSLNSRMFLRQRNPVAGLVIEGCSVSGWTSPEGVISLAGAPVTMFDNYFCNPPAAGRSVLQPMLGAQKALILSENKVANVNGKEFPLLAGMDRMEDSSHSFIRNIPAGERKGIRLDPAQIFFKSAVTIPGKVFDAKRDFGASANGKSDDTVAVQKTIDAARTHGQGAIAYIPAGKYAISLPLKIGGKDYSLGGAGLISTHLIWKGEPTGTTILVEGAENVVIENLLLERPTGLGIRQIGSGASSIVRYEGIFLGRSNNPISPDGTPAAEEPVQKSEKSTAANVEGELPDMVYGGGMSLEKLGAQSTVILDNVLGHLTITDSAAATILAPVTYYGQIRVQGESLSRGGFLGFMTRFCGVEIDYTIYIKNNHNFIVSDYYTETSKTFLRLEGKAGEPAGQVTIQGAKIQPVNLYNIVFSRDYQGTLFLGSNQLYQFVGKISLAGTRSLDAILCGLSFYGAAIEPVVSGGANLYTYGNARAGSEYPGNWKAEKFAKTIPLTDTLPQEKLKSAAKGLDHLRQLGEYDLKLLHPSVKPIGE